MTADTESYLPDESAAPATRRPLVMPAAALAAGILLGRFVAAPAWLWMAVAAAGLAMLAASLRRRGPRHSRPAVAAVALMAAGLGAAWFGLRAEVGPHDISRLAGDEPQLVTVEGVLLESPRQSKRPDNPLLLMDAEGPAYTGMFLRVTAVTLGGRRVAADGRLRVIVSQPMPADPGSRPRTGDRLTVTGLLRRPGPPTNPGQADIRSVYATRGIHASLRTDFWEAIERHSPPWWSPYGWMGGLRQRLRGLMPQGDSPAARVVPALFLGDRSELLETDEQAFVRAGVLHYLAVSGLHVALLSGLVLGVLRLLLVGPRTRGLCLMIFIVAYALATELRPSVVRAGTFFLLLSASWLFGRRRDMLNTLAAATLVVLLLNPADLFHAGFQLSFIVALGLMTVCPKMQAVLFGRRDWTRWAEMPERRRTLWRLRGGFEALLSTCLTAWLFAAPLAACHFHVVAPVGVVATVVVFPFIAALMLLGAVGSAVALVAGTPTAAVTAATQWLAVRLGELVGLLQRVPFGHVYVRDFAWPWVAVSLGLLLVWGYRRELRVPLAGWLAALVFAAGGYVWLGVPRGPDAEVRITTLDVGSGNTALVQGPGGYSLLVDCGSSLLAERTADYVTAPALWRLGVGSLDAVVLTHADADHIKDLPPVLKRIPARCVYLSRHFLTDEKSYDDRALDWLRSEGYEVEYLSRGDRLPAPPGMEISVLGPPVEMADTGDTNATSVVLRVAYQGRAMILTGDATPTNLRDMVREAERGAIALPADAVLLPHHGEQSPELLEFLAATGARHGVMSVGRYRDAKRKPVITWPAELEIWRTWRAGAVSVFLGAEGPRVETFRRP